MVSVPLLEHVAQYPGLKDEVQSVLLFKVTGPDAAWTVDLAGAKPVVVPGERGAAKTTFTLADADLAELAAGKTTAKDLYQHGKLRVDGDVSAAHRLGFLKGLV